MSSLQVNRSLRAMELPFVQPLSQAGLVIIFEEKSAAL
jgi:hypothetical protein